jgi:integrase
MDRRLAQTTDARGPRPQIGALLAWRENPRTARQQWMARVPLKDGTRSAWLELDPAIADHDRVAAERCAGELAAWSGEHDVEIALSAETPVRDYARRWFAEREARGLSSVPSDRSRFRTHVEPRLGTKTMAAVTKRDVEEFVDALDEKVRAGSMSPKNAINVWGLVTKLFDDAHRGKPRSFQVREDNPVRDVRGPDRGARPTKQFLFPNEATRLLTCEEVPVIWREYYAVALYTGLRAGELRALERADVDLEHGVIHVKRAVDRATQAIKDTKGKRARPVPIESEIAPLIEALVARAKNDQDRIVWTPPDERRATTLRQHLKLAGVKRHELHHAERGRSMHITAHDLRSSTITWWAVRGDDVLKVQRRAGHEDLETTQLYVRLAEAIDPRAFGTPFPPLPRELVDRTPGTPLRTPSHTKARSNDINDLRREGDSNPWRACTLT